MPAVHACECGGVGRSPSKVNRKTFIRVMLIRVNPLLTNTLPRRALPQLAAAWKSLAEDYHETVPSRFRLTYFKPTSLST
eukprot:4635056-Prymnesium_polylepis.1